jgi:ATP-dependent Clp protease protease subunit
MAGDEIQMSPAAIMMIHNPWTSAQGDMDDFRAVANVLDTIKKSIMNAYELKTKKSKDEISNLMTAETWMDAEAAVKLGFADSILYQDDEPKVMAVNFGRMTVMNSLQESMKDGWKMIKALRDAENNKIENKKRILALEIDLI